MMILQTPVANKPKYTRAILRQLHIFDTKTFNPLLQEVYLANIFINLYKLLYTFYKLNFLF